MDLRLKAPFTAVISGCSGSGKSTWVHSLLRHKDILLDPPPKKVFYYFMEYQPLFDAMLDENLVNEFIRGMPTSEDVRRLVEPYVGEGGSLIVMDDGMTVLNDDHASLFTMVSHHHDVSVLLLSQNLFHPSKSYRTISINANYHVLMKNPRDQSSVVNFAKQFMPYKSRFVMESYKDATSAQYSYIFFDLKQSTPDFLRVRSRLFLHEAPQIAYLPV